MSVRFKPTIDIWAEGVQDQIRSGKLKLQCGQIVKCGPDAKPAKFVGVTTKGILYVAHDQGSAAENVKRFNDLKVAFRNQQ